MVIVRDRDCTVAGGATGASQAENQVNRAIGAHALHPVIDRVFPFENATSAYDYLASGKHLGKVVIEIQ